MSTFLWNDIAFGPIHSRRLGNSLGINLLPKEIKICSFNCIYCECGWTAKDHIISDNDFPPTSQILQNIQAKIEDCYKKSIPIDSITFSGNGEPTLHPHFAEIVDKVVELRNHFYPNSSITCLSNSTQLHRPDVVSALKKLDNPILKLDAGSDELLQLINKPTIEIAQKEIVKNLMQFRDIAIIQTLFLKGKIENILIDNTTEENIHQWIENLKMIKPRQVMLYSLDRETPQKDLEKVSTEELNQIALKVASLGIKTTVY